VSLVGYVVTKSVCAKINAALLDIVNSEELYCEALEIFRDCKKYSISYVNKQVIHTYIHTYIHKRAYTHLVPKKPRTPTHYGYQ
jgi:hypothetical protein